MAANIIHAAGESAGVPTGTFAVGLSVADETDLRSLQKRLEALQVPFSSVIESHGRYADQLMAVGLSPISDRRTVKGALSSLPLVK